MDIIKKLGLLFNAKQKLQLLGLFFIIMLGALMELVGVSIILPFVQMVVSPDTIMDAGYVKFICKITHINSSHSFLLLVSVSLIIVYIIKNAYICFMNNVLYRFVFDNQRKMSCGLYAGFMKQPYIFHLSKGTPEMIQSINVDVSMTFALVSACLQLFAEISVCLTLSIFLAITDKSITLGVVMTLILFLYVYVKVIKKEIREMSEITRENQIKMTMGIQQGFQGIKEIKLLERESFFLRGYDKSYRAFADASRKFQIYSLMPKPLMEALCISGLMGVISIKLYRGVDLSYFIPTLSVFAVAAFRMLPSTGRIAQYINIISYNRIALDEICKNMELIRGSNVLQENTKNEVAFFDIKKGIYVNNMSFHYPEVEKYVLRNVTFEIPRNKSVAFVGPSGAGKTTLADIILGVLRPVEGAVYADEIDIHQNLSAWNKHLGYIPQTIFLIDDTLRNNIAFGINAKEIDDERIWSVLEEAQLKTFVESLPMGLDTEIGEAGVRISGGQRQRIGIARALYINPDVLVLDEATSALDNDTETAVMEAIEHLSGKKTIIIIAHRLTTIRNCDLVYEVSDETVKLQKTKGE